MLYTTTFMFTNLDFIHTRICYGFLNENNHQEYSVLFVTVYIYREREFLWYYTYYLLYNVHTIYKSIYNIESSIKTMCRSRNMSSVKAVTLVWDILEPMLFLHHDARPSLGKVGAFRHSSDSIPFGVSSKPFPFHNNPWSSAQA
jgi:hypothetical protein